MLLEVVLSMLPLLRLASSTQAWFSADGREALLLLPERLNLASLEGFEEDEEVGGGV